MLARDIISHKPAHHELVAFTREDLDIRDAPALDRALREIRPDWVINASGYTNVDGAEVDPDTAFAVNAIAVGELARLCREHGYGMLHYSTDYVFDGRKDGFYSEDDAPNPVNVYGASKLDGENRVRASDARHLIVRSQWLFGGAGKSFVSTILGRAQSGTPTRAAADQFGCCTFTVDLAELSWELLTRPLEGTIHVANRGRLSRFTLAQHVFEAVGAAHLVSSCSSSEFKSSAARPQNSPLSVRKVEGVLRRRLPHWTEALDRYLDLVAPAGRTAPRTASLR
jgi:dTDP-4-dehydrorhamnose reductase